MDDELYHHGIKGQKWGVRRTPAQLGHTTGTKKKKSSGVASKIAKAASNKISESKENRAAKKAHDNEVKKTQANKKKKVSELTDDELRERIARLELEKRYKDLSPKQTHRGRDFVMGILETSGRNIATQTVTYMMGTGVNKIAKALGSEDDHIVNPKKGQKDK